MIDEDRPLNFILNGFDELHGKRYVNVRNFILETSTFMSGVRVTSWLNLEVWWTKRYRGLVSETGSWPVVLLQCTNLVLFRLNQPRTERYATTICLDLSLIAGLRRRKKSLNSRPLTFCRVFAVYRKFPHSVAYVRPLENHEIHDILNSTSIRSVTCQSCWQRNQQLLCIRNQRRFENEGTIPLNKFAFSILSVVLTGNSVNCGVDFGISIRSSVVKDLRVNDFRDIIGLRNSNFVRGRPCFNT